MLNSVSRTGTIRLPAPDEQRERRLHRHDLERPGCRQARCWPAAGRWSGRRSSPARRAAGRCRPRSRPGNWSGNSSWSVASISASSLIVSTGGPLSRSASERSAVSCARGLDLQRAGQRVRVVLQRDHPPHRRRRRVDQHDPALEDSRRVGECGHSGASVRSAVSKCGAPARAQTLFMYGRRVARSAKSRTVAVPSLLLRSSLL